MFMLPTETRAEKRVNETRLSRNRASMLDQSCDHSWNPDRRRLPLEQVGGRQALAARWWTSSLVLAVAVSSKAVSSTHDDGDEEAALVGPRKSTRERRPNKRVAGTDWAK